MPPWVFPVITTLYWVENVACMKVEMMGSMCQRSAGVLPSPPSTVAASKMMATSVDASTEGPLGPDDGLKQPAPSSAASGMNHRPEDLMVYWS